MTKATSSCWLWPQLLSGPDTKNISFIWCLPALLMHISVQFTRLEKEQVKPPVQWVSCPVLIVDSICSWFFCKKFYLILLPPRTCPLRVMQVASSYTSFCWEQCPSGWVGSASSSLSTLKNSIAWILFPEIVYILTFLQGLSLLLKYCQLDYRKKNNNQTTKSPTSFLNFSLLCRRTRYEMQHILETGH